MSSDSATALSPLDDTMRMPPRAASEVPKAQLNWATRAVWVPVSRARERSSTTARIDTPMRVLYSRIRSPMATATATAMVMAWW